MHKKPICVGRIYYDHGKLGNAVGAFLKKDTSTPGHYDEPRTALFLQNSNERVIRSSTSKRYRAALNIFILFILCSPLFSLAVSPGEATAPAPMDLVKQTVEEARLIFNDGRLSQEQRIRKLREIAGERFDFEEMSKRTLAGHWRKLSPGQRREFVSLFSRLIEDVYSNKVRRYEKEIKEQARDKVFYVDERIDAPYSTVRTNIMTTSGARVSVDYRLIEKERQWRVYDVIVEGVSLVNNYRTQFREIIGGGSYEDLVKRLKEKVEK